MMSFFVASFHQKDILSLRASKFVGFQNYANIFTSQDFLNSIKATLIFAGACFLPLVTVSLFIAALMVSLRRLPRLQNVFKMIYYSHSIVSGVVLATIWLLIFIPRGLANQGLNFLAGNPSPVDFKWLALPMMARLATIIIY